jgi:hypothetical protein
VPATYEKIATTTLGSAAANITFSTISSAYTDLRLVVNCLLTATQDVYLRINGDTGTNYSSTSLKGDGSSASSGRQTSVAQVFLDEAQTTIPTLYEVDIFSYTGSTNKTGLVATSADRNGSGYTQRRVFLWRNTAAITSLIIVPNVTTLKAGTTATLYGILKA